MAARLVLERQLKLDPKKTRSQAYCAAIDAVMSDPDKPQSVFEKGAKTITKAITELKDQDAKLDRRTAKMRDLRDKLRALILAPGNPLARFEPIHPGKTQGDLPSKSRGFGLRHGARSRRRRLTSTSRE
jgi:hypothetical protein